MFANQRLRLKQLVRAERAFWPSVPTDFEFSDDHARANFIEEHKVFTKKSGFDILRMFLIKSGQDDDFWLAHHADRDIEAAADRNSPNSLRR